MSRLIRYAMRAAMVLGALPAMAGGGSMKVIEFSAIQVKMLRGAPTAPQPALPPEVRFVPAAAASAGSDGQIVLTGELVNPTPQAWPMVTFGGNQVNPFSISPVADGQFEWSRRVPLEPPAPMPAVSWTLPAGTTVRFTARFDANRLEYRGTPTVAFSWHFGFSGGREAESGRVSVVMPVLTAP